MSDIAVSVALATHNGARFLADQLESLVRQRKQPAELVVCDDCSSDGTVALVEEFARRSPFDVRIFQNDRRRGFAGTALTAAAAARGDAIALCDQDDVWLEHKLARCADALADGKTLLVMHSSRIVGPNLEDTGRRYPDFPDAQLPPLVPDPWQPVRGMSMVFTADLARIEWARRPRSHYEDGAMNHDEWIYGLARVLGHVATLSEPLALYRQHGANVAGADEVRAAAHARALFTTGADYYAARAAQSAQWSELLAELARVEPDPTRSQRLALGAAAHRALSARLRRRADAYAAPTRALRLWTVVRNRRDYRSRELGGSGAAALARDVVMAALARGARSSR